MDASASDGVHGLQIQQASSFSIRPHRTLPNQGCKATTRHSRRVASYHLSSAWPAGRGRRLESALSMSDKALGAPSRSDLSLLTMSMVLAPGCLAAYTGPCLDLEPWPPPSATTKCAATFRYTSATTPLPRGHRYCETTRAHTYIPAGLQHSQPQPPPQSYSAALAFGARESVPSMSDKALGAPIQGAT
jgi:hypothetical protein